MNRRIPRVSLQSSVAAEALARAAPLDFTAVASIPIAAPLTPRHFGFAGLNALDSAIGNGLDVNAPQSGFAIEPPDQSLCVGNSKIIEMTNLEFAVYDTGGQRTQGPLALSSVFGVPSSDFISDPKCYYDAPTKSFYLSATDLTDYSKSYILIGVMPADATTVKTFAIETTDDGTDGTPDHGVCPCFGDQPLLGANADAIFVSTNEFAMPNLPAAFNGAQIYAISKSDLAAGLAARVFNFEGPIPLDENPAASMQPATSPGGVFDTTLGGTEYLMNALDFFGNGDNRIAVWAITNTCALASPPCSNSFLGITVPPPIVQVPAYSDPPPATQPPATTLIPYGNSIGHSTVEQIDTNDDRLGQLVYAKGKLYAALGTQVRVGSAFHAGIEYFVIKPSFYTKRLPGGVQEQVLKARLLRSGHVAHTGLDLSYPSIGVTTSGRAVMAFSIMGGSRFPSVAWMPIAKAGPPQIHIAAAGAGPDDGVTGYEGLGIGHLGDYSAAVADGENIWMAAEYIPASCIDAQYALDPLCGMTRAPDANWGTFISEFVAPACGPNQPFNPIPCRPRAGGTP
ncbi:MAG: hypothetical protein HY269_07200 [Deltaproteobacteria bacterium]|nr:hypothetical protein [Deltaproteobacteria bacterium]